MAATLFVSEEYIKNYTPIGALVEWTELKPSVEMAQDAFIQDMLGTNFYIYLQDAFENQTLTSDEINLVAKIKPALAYRSAELALPFINMQIKNKGLMTQNGDYSESAELSTVKWFMGELAGRAEFYSVRLTKWLCDNRELFAEYITDNSTDMTPKPGTYDDCDLAFWG